MRPTDLATNGPEISTLVVICQCGQHEPIMRTILVGEQVRCRRCGTTFELSCNNVERRQPPAKQRDLDLR